MRSALCRVRFAALAATFSIWTLQASEFLPKHQITGIGAEREHLTPLTLQARADAMIASGTFGIMRDPHALAGAERISGPRLQKLFRLAEQKTGWPADILAAISYLESWGDPQAESPAGPKGIMQMAEATARGMGLKIVWAKRYRVTKEKVTAKNKRGRMVTRTVKRKIPYTVLVKDERLNPEIAIPAAAQYLARLEQKFGGQDWAIFAYHCGEGCVSDFQDLIAHSKGIDKHPRTVAESFFLCNPTFNRDLYQAIWHHMERDYSPTYWFRVMRAKQLLAIYHEDPKEYERLIREYRYESNPSLRAPHRLSVWLRPEDAAYRTCEDIRKDSGTRLVRSLDNPDLLGFRLQVDYSHIPLSDREYYLQATPATLGTLIYISFETRRLFEAMHPHGEHWVPLEVTGLVRPLDFRPSDGVAEGASHCTGQVFDLSIAGLPAGEREALRFVLEDLGWDGYLGFVEESVGTGEWHIGCAPNTREFFAEIFAEALEAVKQG